MICPNCSKELPSNTPYCAGCGNSLQPITDKTTKKYPSSYLKLGGWFAFFAYVPLFGLTFSFIRTLLALSAIDVMHVLAPSFATQFRIAITIYSIGSAVIILLVLAILLMIQDDNPRFLLWYEIVAIISICASLAIIIILPGVNPGSII